MTEQLNTRLAQLEGKFETHMDHNIRWQDEQSEMTQRILSKLDSHHDVQTQRIHGLANEMAETRGRDRNLALFGSVTLSAVVAYISHKIGAG